jgi:hypothetical protein
MEAEANMVRLPVIIVNTRKEDLLQLILLHPFLHGQEALLSAVSWMAMMP